MQRRSGSRPCLGRRSQAMLPVSLPGGDRDLNHACLLTWTPPAHLGRCLVCHHSSHPCWPMALAVTLIFCKDALLAACWSWDPEGPDETPTRGQGVRDRPIDICWLCNWADPSLCSSLRFSQMASS
jgi:hypothetical protein